MPSCWRRFHGFTTRSTSSLSNLSHLQPHCVAPGLLPLPSSRELWCATYNFLWSFAAYRSGSMIGIYNNLRSECRFTARSSGCNESDERGGCTFRISYRPDHRRSRYEDPIIESQRFSFLLLVSSVSRQKRMAIIALPSLRFIYTDDAVLWMKLMNEINRWFYLFNKNVVTISL